MSGSAEEMIAKQLVKRGIHDPRVLDAMRRIPREEFIPKQARGDAYIEECSIETTGSRSWLRELALLARRRNG